MSVQKIAITYDNGQVFQHFGHTETFKLYEVEDGTRSLFFYASIKGRVTDCALCSISRGVPAKSSCPPASPPPGPSSMM